MRHKACTVPFNIVSFICVFALSSLLFTGCGSDGAQGIQGPPGPGAGIQAESCSICHSEAGDDHQAYFDDLYQDNVIVVTNLSYANNGVNDTVTFNMMKAGAAFDCTEADSLGIYFTTYTGSGFEQAARVSLTTGSTKTYLGSGNCQVVVPQSSLGDLSALDGLIVLYGRDETVGQIPNTRVRQNKFPFAALLETGAGVGYASAANNDGCEKCHTVPFLKHGYIYGQVAGDPTTDFYTCKACHLDNGDGGHFMWQLLVDNPQLIIDLENQYGVDWEDSGDSRLVPYAYKTRLMNDVHMSHAMEFPYPQSMANCATCHEGKLGTILTDANFTAETCKSCHPVTGPAGGTDPHRAPALETLWANAGVFAIHSITDICNNAACHAAGSGSPATTFSEIHTGYDKQIYSDAAGTKYSSVITVTIDSASFVGNDLTISFSAAESPDLPGLAVTDIIPTVMVGLYGYDTKDFIIGPHERDANRERFLEYDVDGVDDNPRFTTVTASGGSWEVIADLSMWADMINDGTVKRVEIAVTPLLEDANGVKLALNAASRTFDLIANDFDDAFYSDIVRVATGCNNCHDALATTFHTNDPGRGGSIVVCRLCHIVKSGGSHLELQSRSIDSYVHAIHSFQAFDIDQIDFADPIEDLHYGHHIEFVYPTLGIRNCESCHNSGTYNVPDQSKSLSGALSAAESLTGKTRNIGAVPMYITGPATRACGACHRSHAINEDNASELASLFSHWRTNGYLVEVVDTSNEEAEVLTVIDDIFGIL